jgi:acetoin utilization deacetylase AcuC-like enzyme
MTRVSRLLLLCPLLASAVAVAAPRAKTPRQEVWYHTGYGGGVVGPQSGMSAQMGPTKMPPIFDAIWRGHLVPAAQLHTDATAVSGAAKAAPPIDLASLRAVHSDRYLKALFTGQPRGLACSQGLPTWNEGIARGWLLNVGGLYEAATTALSKQTITANLGHGYHHAGVTQGMGYCTINGLAVVASKLVRENKARRVMVIDLDQHEGNGTAECTLGDGRIWNVSIYGSNMGGPPAASNNRVLQVKHGELGKGTPRDVNYLSVISSTLPQLIRQHNPDLILYQAGMDPYDCSGVSAKALAVRDAYVFSLARSMGKPLTWVLAGGYTDVPTLVQLHTTTLRMANDVLARVKVGDTIRQSLRQPYDWSATRGTVSFPDWGSLLGGAPRIKTPSTLDAAQTAAYVARRQQTLQQQRLPDGDLQAAYRTLFP